MSAEDWARAIGKLIAPTLIPEQSGPTPAGQDKIPQQEQKQVQSQASEPVASSTGWRPLCDVKKGRDSYLLHIELPGIDPSTVKLTFDKGVLQLSGERPNKLEAGEKHYRSERNFGAFNRAFAVPKNIIPDGITAKCNHGLLEVRIPRAPRASKGFKLDSTDSAALHPVAPEERSSSSVDQQGSGMSREIPISTGTQPFSFPTATSTSEPSATSFGVPAEGMSTDIGAGQGLSSVKAGFGAPSDVDTSLQPSTFRTPSGSEEQPAAVSRIHEPKDPGLVRDIGESDEGTPGRGLGFVQHVKPPQIEPLGKKGVWKGPAFQGETLMRPQQKGLQKEMDRETGMEKLETPNEPLPRSETQSSQV